MWRHSFGFQASTGRVWRNSALSAYKAHVDFLEALSAPRPCGALATRAGAMGREQKGGSGSCERSPCSLRAPRPCVYAHRANSQRKSTHSMCTVNNTFAPTRTLSQIECCATRNCAQALCSCAFQFSRHSSHHSTIIPAAVVVSY